jgi:hypothetical protein
MYSYIGPNLDGEYLFFDPKGAVICVVANKEGADELLLHLNRSRGKAMDDLDPHQVATYLLHMNNGRIEYLREMVKTDLARADRVRLVERLCTLAAGIAESLVLT